MLKKRSGLVAAFLAIILLPHCFSSTSRRAPLPLGAPTVFSGDEPHHLVILSSLLGDGDFDVADDYESARAGGVGLGRRFAGVPVDHHTTWYVAGERMMWRDVYGINPRWRVSSETGQLRPIPREFYAGRDRPAGQAEYSQHPPGVSFLLAPLLWPLGQHWLLEPFALILSGLCVFITAVAIRALARLFVTDPVSLDFVTALAVLGTPAWHYGRTLFGEPFLMALVTAGLALALVRRCYFIAGVCFALAFLIKPIALLVAFPLWCLLATRRDVRALISYTAPMAAGVGIYLLLNWSMFGGASRIAQPAGEWDFQFFEHLFGLRSGVLPYAPVIAIGLLGAGFLYRERRDVTVVIYGGALLYASFVLIRLNTGGFGYGPRYFVPILPLLTLGLLRINLAHPRRWVRLGVYAVCLMSVATNAVGAVHSWRYWGEHPLASLAVRYVL